MVLGDNVIERNFRLAAEGFAAGTDGARILLKRVPDPERFGVPVFRKRKIVGIEEKPRRAKSPYAVTGIYMYDARVFDVIRTLKPSRRGELEITDVNNWYLRRGALGYEILRGWWTDAGTFEALHRAGNLVARTGANKLDGPARRARRTR